MEAATLNRAEQVTAPTGRLGLKVNQNMGLCMCGVYLPASTQQAHQGFCQMRHRGRQQSRCHLPQLNTRGRATGVEPGFNQQVVAAKERVSVHHMPRVAAGARAGRAATMPDC